MEDRECRKKTSTGGERDDSFGVLTPEISEVILFYKSYGLLGKALFLRCWCTVLNCNETFASRTILP